MITKYKSKQIRDLINGTNWEDGAFEKDEQPYGYVIGYFTPANNNWSYEVKIVKKNNKIYIVTTAFDVVRGYREIYL